MDQRNKMLGIKMDNGQKALEKKIELFAERKAEKVRLY